MIIIERNKGQAIKIGDNITITVMRTPAKARGGEIRLGIDAPKDVGIWREELYVKEHQDAKSTRNG